MCEGPAFRQRAYRAAASSETKGCVGQIWESVLFIYMVRCVGSSLLVMCAHAKSRSDDGIMWHSWSRKQYLTIYIQQDVRQAKDRLEVVGIAQEGFLKVCPRFVGKFLMERKVARLIKG